MQPFCERDAADAHIGPFVVIRLKPLCSEFPDLFNAFNDVLV